MDRNELKLLAKVKEARPHGEGRFATGMLWGTLISVVLWISIIGWIMVFVK
ncbi:hypothetical protein OIN60_08990 [Paenibacillus sp. P96]|uniref:YmiA family membrane protein n=1 Tax=Paenibacillus zeirhizosphaerae TaxID=2987519 RepID=A0ABT9FQA3_9BACL|nr:hypothetical protein [Paenibacillus sp. P96]MDP4096904.1 hypothetical protein [Paenibacillus sp. P96]